MHLITKYIKNIFLGKSKFGSDHNQLYYNFHDLSTYIDFLSTQPSDAIKSLEHQPTLNMPYFDSKSKISDVENQLGKSVINVDIDTLSGLKILHYKKIIKEDTKIKYNFHFFKNRLVFYSEIYPYLNKERRRQMFNDFMKNQKSDCFSLQKKCVFDYHDQIIVVENTVDLSFHYIFSNPDLISVFQKAKEDNVMP